MVGIQVTCFHAQHKVFPDVLAPEDDFYSFLPLAYFPKEFERKDLAKGKLLITLHMLAGFAR